MIKLRRTKAAGLASATALVAAALAFGATSLVLGPKQAPKFVLSSAAGFTITSTISSSPTSQVPALLDPGAQRYLWYTVQNPLSVPITVSALSITAVTPPPAPANCAASNLDLSHATFNGSLTVAGNGQTNAVSVPISLKDTGPGENGCKGASFGFSYTGTATYTEVYATSALLASSSDPSVVGQGVTYRATVAATVASGQDPLPNSPTGAVTFKDGTTTICSGVALTSATATTSTAQCSPAAYLVAATHPITAVYTNADGNFSGSSSLLSQVVSPSSTTTALAAAPDPSTFGQSVTLTATTVAASGPTPTGTASFYLGTPSTSHALLGTGTLNAAGKGTFVLSGLPGGSDSLYAVYGGSSNDLSSTSTVSTQTVGFTIACVTNAVNAGYTVKSGQSICISGRVNGGVTVQPGAALYLNGATINGGINSTGATAFMVCGSTVNGNVVVSGSSGFVTIGDGDDDGPPGCGANTINSSSLTLSSNGAGLELAGDHITGTVTVSGTTGAGATSEDAAPEVEGNTVTGALSCGTSNNPVLSDGGQKNVVTGTRTGQCSAAGF
ncbi:MAG: hypothetical protein JWO62_3078 [Acidimicrobiaceae bacterium]|nr:hypothetical protein [Acidimicrobiaceae bacterium]